MKNIDWKIEGLTTIALEEKIHKERKSNKAIYELFQRNQLSYITAFFSEFLSIDGKYMEGAHLKDLLILYYIDYYIKEKLIEQALKINKYLNVMILNCYESKIISKRTGDNNNTFGSVVEFYKTELTGKEQKQLLSKFNDLYDTNFESVEAFIESLSYIVVLRNAGLHHYSVVSYQYATIIEFGKKHVIKNGEEKTLEDTIYHLSLFVNKKSANKLMDKITNIITKYKYSTLKIKKTVCKQMSQILNFDALKSVSRENIHVSVIDVIKN